MDQEKINIICNAFQDIDDIFMFAKQYSYDNEQLEKITSRSHFNDIMEFTLILTSAKNSLNPTGTIKRILKEEEVLKEIYTLLKEIQKALTLEEKKLLEEITPEPFQKDLDTILSILLN